MTPKQTLRIAETFKSRVVSSLGNQGLTCAVDGRTYRLLTGVAKQQDALEYKPSVLYVKGQTIPTTETFVWGVRLYVPEEIFIAPPNPRRKKQPKKKGK